jgi:hypothetical protein
MRSAPRCAWASPWPVPRSSARWRPRTS